MVTTAGFAFWSPLVLIELDLGRERVRKQINSHDNTTLTRVFTYSPGFRQEMLHGGPGVPRCFGKISTHICNLPLKKERCTIDLVGSASSYTSFFYPMTPMALDLARSGVNSTIKE